MLAPTFFCVPDKVTHGFSRRNIFKANPLLAVHPSQKRYFPIAERAIAVVKDFDVEI